MRGARIIGPNCLGLIVPGVAKMGGIGGPAKNAAAGLPAGLVGVMSRSGGMTTEISSTLTAAGLGVSTAISIGGDAIIGSTYAELMPQFEADEQTEAIVIYTEPGGRMEAQLAEWVAENDSRLPIIAFMAGRFMDDEEMQGMSFGHAGTIVEGKEDTATEKIARLEAAGIPVVRADRRDPRRGEVASSRREERGMMPDAIFIDVEVDDDVDAATCAREEARGGLPGQHLQAATDSRRRRSSSEQPRRVRALRPLLRAAPDGKVRVRSSTTAKRFSHARVWARSLAALPGGAATPLDG